MIKKVSLDSDIRGKVLSGLDTLVSAVGSTLGPKGRTVILEADNGRISVTKDGVSVAKAITLKDPIENAAVQIAKEAALKTNSVAGDGTTTATILQHALVKHAMETGGNPVDVVVGIKDGVAKAVEAINAMATPVTSPEYEKIAYISSNGDTEIATAVASAFNVVGSDGVVMVEESNSTTTAVDIVEGTQIPGGYVSPYLINQDNSTKCIFENARIVITDKKITSADLMAISNIVQMANGAPILFVAEDYDAEVIAAFVVNKLQGRCSICAIKLSLYGEDKTQRASDLATLTGGKLVSESLNTTLADFRSSWFGVANKVVVSTEKTIIIGGQGDEEDLEKLRAQLVASLEEADPNSFEYRKIRSRITYLDGIVSVIRVGASTGQEMKEKRDRVDDAINAVRSAIKSGWVPGGAVAFVKAIEVLDKTLEDMPKDDIRRVGYGVVKSALLAPITTLFTNAGKSSFSLAECLTTIKNSNSMAYDIRTDKWGHPLTIGLIDPALVLTEALNNSMSSAITLLTTNAVVVNDPEENKNSQMPQMPMY